MSNNSNIISNNKVDFNNKIIPNFIPHNKVEFFQKVRDNFPALSEDDIKMSTLLVLPKISERKQQQKRIIRNT